MKGWSLIYVTAAAIQNFALKASAGNSCSALKLRMNEEGWGLDEHDHLVIWVPPEMRTSVEGSFCRVEIDFADAQHGEDWTECFERD